MAWNDPRFKAPSAGPALDIGGTNQVLDAAGERERDALDDAGARMQSIALQADPRRMPEDFAEFAINDQTGEVMLPDGSIKQLTSPLMVQLATLKMKDGAPVPKNLSTRQMQNGWRLFRQSDALDAVETAGTDSDFLGELGAALKGGLGLGWAAIDAQVGNDDPNNAWANAGEDYSNQQTMAQYNASRSPWFSNWDSFWSGLGQTAGNIGSNVTMAAPALVAGAAVGSMAAPGAGTAGGAIAAGGTAVVGGAQAYGEQAVDFYESAMEEMGRMSTEELMRESPLYAQLIQQGMADADAKAEVAIQGARAAGTAGLLPGAIEGFIGGKLGGNVLAKLGLKNVLAQARKEAAATAVQRTAGGAAARWVGRNSARAGVFGAAAGAGEMLETGLGQSAGARVTGLGDESITGNMSIEEGIKASQGGALFGFFGGRASNPARDDLSDALNQNAGRQSPNALLPAPPQTGMTPRPESRAWTSDGQVNRPGDNIIDGEFSVVPPQLQAPQQAALPAPRPTINLPYEQDPAAGALPSPQAFDQQQAQQAFVEWTGLSDPAEIEAAMPELLDFADENPEFAQIMQAAGIYPADAQPAPIMPTAPMEDPTAGAPTLQPPGQQMPRRPMEDPTAGGATMQAPRWQPPQQVASPEPIAAPTERTPDGRPMGVAPAALVNPEPMDPEQARQAAVTRNERRARAGVAPSPVEPQAAATPDGVTPSTPEPAGDIAAQLDALLDPQSGRSSVFVAEGNEAQIPTELPPDVIRVARKGRGTLLTLDPTVARKFQRGKWTDADTQQALGYSENKTADNAASGVVVEARTPEGNVAAQQLATNAPANRRAAAVAVKRQARKDATVVETTPQQAQAERAARSNEAPKVERKLGPKTKAVIAKTTEKKSPESTAAARLAEKGLDVATDAELQTPERGEKRAKTNTERAATSVKVSEAEARPAARVAIPEGTAREVAVKTGGRSVVLTGKLVSEAGVKGHTVDLRTRAPNEEERAKLAAVLEGSLPAAERPAMERALHHIEQVEAVFDAAVEDAEEALVKRITASAEGVSAKDAIEHVRLMADIAASRVARAAEGKDNRGRPLGRPKGSILLRQPLLVEEMLHLGRIIRREARAEAALPQDAGKSASRRLIPLLFPNLQAVLDAPEMLREAVAAVAEMTDSEIDAQVRAIMGKLQDSPLAKGVMRGMDAVARVQQFENAEKVKVLKRREAMSAEEKEQAADAVPTPETLGLKEVSGRFTTSYKNDAPKNAVDIVNGWLEMLQRSGIKPDTLTVLTKATAELLYPEAFAGTRSGRYAQVTVDGEVRHVIAVDFDTYGDEYGTEILAHEFGEYAGRAIFNRSDRATQDAVMDSYQAWLTAHRHLSPADKFRSHAPALLRTLASDKLTDDYASRFSEWLANHVARYMLTKPEPRGIVEKFFARVGEMLGKIWREFLGENTPDAAVEAMIDAWVAGRMEHAAAGTHRITTTTGEMDLSEPATPAGARVAAAAARRAANVSEGTKKVYAGFAKGGLAGLREELVNEGGSVFRTLMKSAVGGKLRKAAHWITSMDQLVAAYDNTPIGKPLREWVRLQRRAGQLANVVLNGGKFTVGDREVSFDGVADILERAHNLPRAMQDLLQDVMHDSTRYGINPDKSFESQDWLWKGVSKQTAALNRQRYEALHSRWVAMAKAHAEATEIYTALRDRFTDLKTREYEQLEANIRALNLSAKVEKLALSRLDAGRRELKQGPYFPFMREGDWIITATLPPVREEAASHAEALKRERDLKAQNPGAKVEMKQDEDGKWEIWMFRRSVQFFNSEAAAEAAREAMLQNLADEYKVNNVDIEDVVRALSDDEGATALDTLVSKPKSKQDGYKEIGQHDTEFLSEFRAELRAAGKLDEQMAEMFESAMIEALPELSPRKAMLRRENVLGASRDMLRAYTIRFFGTAHTFAHTVFNPQIREQWNKLTAAGDSKEAKAAGVEYFAPAGDLTNTLRKHLELEAKQRELSFSNAIQNAFLQVTSLSFLAFSPAYLLMNALQPSMVAAPVLAGALGKGRKAIGGAIAGKYVQQAYEGAPQFFSKRGLQDFMADLRRMQGKAVKHDAHALTEQMLDQFSRDGANGQVQTKAEEKAMLTEMLELGRLDFSFLDVLQDIMQGNKGTRTLAKVTRLGMTFAQQGEAMNRIVTALAAYRIARNETKLSHEQAIQYAYDVVGETQIDYSTFNRPPLLKTPWLRVALQFKMFMQGMYGMLVKNVASAVAGATPEERKAARSTLRYLIGTHLAIAGTTGLGPVAWVAKGAIGLTALAMGRDDDDDEWKDADTIFAEQAAYVFGETGGEVARKGLPTLLGGDISGRVSFPNLLESRYVGLRNDDSGDEVLNKWTLYALGAGYANVARMAKGVGNAVDGDPYTDWADGLPTGARGAIKAYRLGSQGIVDKDGDVLLSPSEVGSADVMMRVLGVTPVAEQRIHEERAARRGTIASIRGERELLIKRMRTAESRGDADKVREDISEFNANVPKHFAITAESIRSAQRSKAKREAGERTRDDKAVGEILQ